MGFKSNEANNCITLCLVEFNVFFNPNFNISKSFSFATFSQQPNGVVVYAYLSKFFFLVSQSILIISFCGVPSVYVFNVWFLGFELDFCADDSKE